MLICNANVSGKFYQKRQVGSSKRNGTRKVIVKNRKKGNKIRSRDIIVRDRVKQLITKPNWILFNI